MTSHDRADEIALAQPAHWGLWGTILWGAVISVIFVALQVLTIAVALVAREGNLSNSAFTQQFIAAGTNGSLISLATFVTTVVCCGVIVGVIRLKKGSVLSEYLNIHWVSPKTTLTWIGLLAGFLVMSDWLTTSLGRPIVPEFMSTTYATASPVWALWVALIIAAPLFEETFFRGFLFKGFEASAPGPIGAVFVTSALWAMTHIQYDTYAMATIFCLGLLLGAARVVTGSLLVPLGLHAATNLVATIQAAAALR